MGLISFNMIFENLKNKEKIESAKQCDLTLGLRRNIR